ncbi:MAG: BLUF domain-containing protein [Gammaproteobacteria bacterium]|nr:BLUF domain-containing protein [Gammaproteobacteria bacterium]MBU1443237.1 BLUF domain-containing protein [Gammaproteobacteria bacterium]MBU2288076.1 BLUF domain-containing protein [Gammaproteobacteria bacterium]MBU2408050.1 BLUF domain-containing protein [Gammaproteobacteria bacterium]
MIDLYEFLYCSELAPDQPTTVVGQIVSQARTRNAAQEITGLLVFDGLHFCQHLEGPRRAVEGLMERIACDPRHVEILVNHRGPLAERRYRRFELGLAQVEDGDGLGEIRQHQGPQALERFLALRPGFDISS